MNIQNKLVIVLFYLFLGSAVGLLVMKLNLFHYTPIRLLVVLLMAIPFIKIKFRNEYLTYLLSLLVGYLFLPLTLNLMLGSISGLFSSLSMLFIFVSLPIFILLLIRLTNYHIVAILVSSIISIYFILSYSHDTSTKILSVGLVMIIPYLVQVHRVKDIKGGDYSDKLFYLLELTILFNLCLVIGKLLQSIT